MRIYIDQSSKIEQTSQDTVIAYSNGKQKSLLIKAHDKRSVQESFRQAGKPNIFVLRTFAVLIFLLIRDDLKHIDGIRIDREYVGKEWLIKQYLLQLMRRHGFHVEKNSIEFVHIGKNHRAHNQAISTLRGKILPGIIVAYQDILPYLMG